MTINYRVLDAASKDRKDFRAGLGRTLPNPSLVIEYGKITLDGKVKEKDLKVVGA